MWPQRAAKRDALNCARLDLWLCTRATSQQSWLHCCACGESGYATVQQFKHTHAIMHHIYYEEEWVAAYITISPGLTTCHHQQKSDYSFKYYHQHRSIHEPTTAQKTGLIHIHAIPQQLAAPGVDDCLHAISMHWWQQDVSSPPRRGGYLLTYPVAGCLQVLFLASGIHACARH
jgi:hypothetical protein